MTNPAAIREALGRSLLELNPTGAWPVNLHAIVTRLGLELRFESANGEGGTAYLHLGEQPTIIICRSDTKQFISAKERFLIAHELAHWVVWRRLGVVPSKGEYWDHETICNTFAGHLLVPPRTLRSFLLRQRTEGIDPVEFPDKVAKAANVSWDVAAISISAEPAEDAAYLRLVKKRKDSSHRKADARDSDAIIFQVICSSVSAKPGSFLGRFAQISNKLEPWRDPTAMTREALKCDLVAWLDTLKIRNTTSKSVTLDLGQLHLTDVPCTFIRNPGFWAIHFSRSHKGVCIT